MSCVLPSFIHAGVLGSIVLKDGSIIHGDIVDMADGTLKVEAAFGAKEPFLIKWGEVVNMATSQPVVLVLGDGVRLTGIVEKGDSGQLRLTAKPLAEPVLIELATVTAINPPHKVPVKFKINLNFGSKFSSGNTDDAQVNFLSGFVARSERLRVILDARYFYAEEDSRVTDRNAFGTIDLNYFMTQRLYWFLAVLMQQDTFDDLNLRTAVTTGPGYQFIEHGDFASPYFTMMTLQGDLGAGFLNEDRKVDSDDSHGVYRWSLRWEWEPIKKLTVFHQHQGFPEVGDLSNWYINTLQGIRFDVWEGITISGQVQYNYDNEPAAGSSKGDTTVFLALGYNYEN
jgi:putative salt-induced outer membrane protein YdiY